MKTILQIMTFSMIMVSSHLSVTIAAEPVAVSVGVSATGLTSVSAAFCGYNPPRRTTGECVFTHAIMSLLVTFTLAKSVQDVKPLALTHIPGEEIHPLLESVALELLLVLEEQGYEEFTLEDSVNLIRDL